MSYDHNITAPTVHFFSACFLQFDLFVIVEISVGSQFTCLIFCAVFPERAGSWRVSTWYSSSPLHPFPQIPFTKKERLATHSPLPFPPSLFQPRGENLDNL